MEQVRAFFESKYSISTNNPELITKLADCCDLSGKSTTIAMLTGMTPPSDGDAVFPGGLQITDNMPAVRKMLGVCPQHDILFVGLTVLEHLKFFAAIKGVPQNKLTEVASKMVAEVGLKEKANANSTTLSGGQKRKLSLGMALIGDSKVVILDGKRY
jgi:ABC-type multidrug transport system ATPase subunit